MEGAKKRMKSSRKKTGLTYQARKTAWITGSDKRIKKRKQTKRFSVLTIKDTKMQRPSNLAPVGSQGAEGIQIFTGEDAEDRSSEAIALELTRLAGRFVTIDFIGNTTPITGKMMSVLEHNATMNGLEGGVQIIPLRTISKISVSPYGYLSTLNDSVLRVVDTGSNSIIAAIPNMRGANSFAFTPNGEKMYIAVTLTSELVIIDTFSHAIIDKQIMVSDPTGIAITPDGARAYLSNRIANSVIVIDTATFNVITTITVGSWPGPIQVTPDGSKVYVCNMNGSCVSVINTATNEVTATIGFNGICENLIIAPDGKEVYVTCPLRKGIMIINTATDTDDKFVLLPGTPKGITITPDGAFVYIALSDTTLVAVLDTVARELVGLGLSVVGNPQSVAATPDGTRVYVTINSPPSVAIIHAASNLIIDSFPVADAPNEIVISPFIP